MNAPVLTALTPPRQLFASDLMFLVEHGLIEALTHRTMDRRIEAAI